jgi:hypothetical protein
MKIFFTMIGFSRIWKTIVLFAARGVVSGVFQAAYVYTPEVKNDSGIRKSVQKVLCRLIFDSITLLKVYPTSMRSIGIGTCSSMARIGAMVTPYVAQVFLKDYETKANLLIFNSI